MAFLRAMSPLPLFKRISQKGRKNMSDYILKYDNDLHRKVKARAASEGRTIRELIVQALQEYLKRKAKNELSHK